MASALFTAHVCQGLYEGLGRQPPKALPTLSTLFIVMSLVAWFSSYSRANGIAWPLDMGWFLWAAWIFVIPYYVLRKEGVGGLARIGLFILTYLAAAASGWAVTIWTRVLAGGN